MKHRLNGPLAMLAGFILFSLVPLLVKAAHNLGATAPAAVLVRFSVGLLCVMALVTFTRQRLQTGNLGILALRGLVGGLAVLFFFVSVTRIGAGLGTLLNYTHSIWSNLLALLVLRQRPVRSFWLLLAVGVVGLYLVIDPAASMKQPAEFWGALAGLFSGLMGGCAILCIKKLRKTDSALTIFFSFALGGFVVAWFPLAPDLLQSNFAPLTSGLVWPALGVLVMLGLFSFGGQMLFTAGYKYTSIQLGSLLSLTTPALAVINGCLFLGESINLGFFLGGTMILAACVAMSILEKRQEPSLQTRR